MVSITISIQYLTNDILTIPVSITLQTKVWEQGNSWAIQQKVQPKNFDGLTNYLVIKFSLIRIILKEFFLN